MILGFPDFSPFYNFMNFINLITNIVSGTGVVVPKADPPLAETFTYLVGMVGVEPTILSEYGPKPYAYANSATSP